MAATSSGQRSALVELKRRNEWAVIVALRNHGELTRPQLVAETGLSRSTVANLVGELGRRGVVDERERAAQGRAGRFGRVISLRSSAGVAIGIAIDRESIRLAAVDLANQVLAETSEPIAAAATGADILTRCALLVRTCLADLAVPLERTVGVGIGLPGAVDVAFGGVHPTASLRRWAGLDVRHVLAAHLDGVHVFPDNDANYGALGEHHYGAGRGAENLIYIRVAAGVGGGLIVDGRLHRGDRGFAGEIGHSTAVDDGAPCPCGRRGCLATVASTRAIADRLAPTHGPDLDSERILALAGAGDGPAIAELQRAGTHIGRALGGLVNALNPGVIILGGELGAGSSHLLKATSRALSAHVQPIAGHDLRLEHAALGSRSEVLGASARVLHDTRHVRSYVAAA